MLSNNMEMMRKMAECLAVVDGLNCCWFKLLLRSTFQQYVPNSTAFRLSKMNPITAAISSN